MPRDIFGSHNWGRDTGLQRVEVRQASTYRQCKRHSLPQKNYLAQKCQ